MKKTQLSENELKQKERKQKRESIIDDDTELGRFFELTTINK